jgi:hypothetical protein
MIRGIIALLLFAAIIGLGISEQIYVNRSFNELSQQILQVSEQENTISATTQMDEILEKWQKKSQTLTIFAPHVDVKDIVVLLAEYRGLLDRDLIDEADVKAQVIQEFLKDRQNILSFKWQNVL